MQIMFLIFIGSLILFGIVLLAICLWPVVERYRYRARMRVALDEAYQIQMRLHELQLAHAIALEHLTGEEQQRTLERIHREVQQLVDRVS